MKSICLIGLLFSHILVAQVKTFTKDDFKDVKQLHGVFWNEQIRMADPTDIYLKGSDLIVLDETNKNQFIHIINTVDKSSKLTGQEGFGPGEIMSTQLVDIGLEQDKFWVYDIENYAFHEYSLSSKRTKSIRSIKLKEELPLNVIWTKDGELLMMDWTLGKSVFNKKNLASNKSVGMGDWSSLIVDDERVPLVNRVQSHHGVMYQNDQRNLVAMGALIVDYLLIYDDNSREFVALYGPQRHKLRYFKSRPIAQRGFNAYINVKVKEDRVFALYSGKYDKDLEASSEAYNCNTIFVFNKKGEPLYSYLLDETIQCFDIDLGKGVLYGLNFDNNHDSVFTDHL